MSATVTIPRQIALDLVQVEPVAVGPLVAGGQGARANVDDPVGAEVERSRVAPPGLLHGEPLSLGHAPEAVLPDLVAHRLVLSGDAGVHARECTRKHAGKGR